MSDPRRCCIENCEGIAAYKVGARGFCFRHKEHAEQARKSAITNMIRKHGRVVSPLIHHSLAEKIHRNIINKQTKVRP